MSVFINRVLWTLSVLAFSKHFKKLLRLFSLKMGRKDRLSERTLWTSLQQPSFTFSPHTRPSSISVLAHFVRAVASAQNFLPTNESLIDLQSMYFFSLSHPWAKDAVNTAASPCLPSQRQIPPCTRSLRWTLCSLHMVGGTITSSSKWRNKFIKVKQCRGSCNSGYKLQVFFSLHSPASEVQTYL